MAGAVTEEEKLRQVALFSLENLKGSQCCCLQLHDGGEYKGGKREIQKCFSPLSPQMSISILFTAFIAGF